MQQHFKEIMDDELVTMMTEYEKRHPFFQVFPIEKMDTLQSELLLGYLHTWQYSLFKAIVEYGNDFGVDAAVARMESGGVKDGAATYDAIVVEYDDIPKHPRLYDLYIHSVAVQRAAEIDKQMQRLFMLTASASIDLLTPTGAKMGVKDHILTRLEQDGRVVVMSLCLVCGEEYSDFPNSMDDKCRAVVMAGKES